MNETTGSRRPIGKLVTAAVIWVPFVVLWCVAAESAADHLSGTDWRGNHATKVALERAALVIGGVPTTGAAIGWVLGRSFAPPRTAHWAATGLLLGALGLVVTVVILFFVALAHMRIPY